MIDLRGAAVACATCVAVLGSVVLEMPLTLIWNASASAPIGLYAVRGLAAPDVGDLVAVRPPDALANFLDERGYLPIGAPMLKRVAALSGQTICRWGVVVSVDGVELGRALERDRNGRPLPVWQGCRRVLPSELFLLNIDANGSLDGRYFAALPKAFVIGRAVPLVTTAVGDRPFFGPSQRRDVGSVHPQSDGANTCRRLEHSSAHQPALPAIFALQCWILSS